MFLLFCVIENIFSQNPNASYQQIPILGLMNYYLGFSH